MQRNVDSLRRERIRQGNLLARRNRITGVLLDQLPQANDNSSNGVKFAAREETVTRTMRNFNRSQRNTVKRSLRRLTGTTAEFALDYDHDIEIPSDFSPRAFKSVLIEKVSEAPLIVSKTKGS